MHMVAPTSTIRVHEVLRTAILDGQLAPGERLRAEALAGRFGTSRTPVREALLMLEREGLVDVQPNRGAIVRSFDPEDLLDLYDVRALIEPHAAARAATRIAPAALARLRELCDAAADPDATVADQIVFNEEFHRIVVEAAESPRLVAAMRAVAGIPREFRTAFWASEQQRAQSLFCHCELVTAFAAGQAGLAEAVMRMHILGAREFLLQAVQEHA
jgi:DNA-binding GntR family transcriptional regulator